MSDYKVKMQSRLPSAIPTKKWLETVGRGRSTGVVLGAVAPLRSEGKLAIVLSDWGKVYCVPMELVTEQHLLIAKLTPQDRAVAMEWKAKYDNGEYSSEQSKLDRYYEQNFNFGIGV